MFGFKFHIYNIYVILLTYDFFIIDVVIYVDVFVGCTRKDVI